MEIPSQCGDIARHNYRIYLEVAYIQRQFAVARFFLKNRNGTWSKGSDFGEASNVTFFENDSTVRTVGPINNTHVENNVSGGLVVIRNATNIAIPAGNSYVQDTEYWIYASSNIDGITDSANPPGPLNLDWIRVYNIPPRSRRTHLKIWMHKVLLQFTKKEDPTYQKLQNYSLCPRLSREGV